MAEKKEGLFRGACIVEFFFFWGEVYLTLSGLMREGDSFDFLGCRPRFFG